MYHLGSWPACMIGKIVSMSLALDLVIRLMIHNLYAILNRRLAWCHRLTISDEASWETDFRLSEITNFNGRHIWPNPSTVRIAYSDASATGMVGTWLNMVTLWQMVSGPLRRQGKVPPGMETFKSKLEHERVHWFTDNQNVIRIVQYGSTTDWGSKYFESEWIPGEQNELAGYYSRIVNHDDWMLNSSIFTWLDTIWGPQTIDRFANLMNTQMQRFNSRFWCPGLEALDAFMCTWARENNWWCPPVHLVPRVVRHAQNTKAKGYSCNVHSYLY